jgi:hypothetical protein
MSDALSSYRKPFIRIGGEPDALRPPGPHFLGIGAQKAGTTWLWTQLKRHPQVWMPPRKELHYFSRHVMAPGGGILAEPNIFRRLTGKARANVLWRRLVSNDLRRSIRERNWDEFRWLIRFFFKTPTDQWYESLFSNRGDLLTGEITPSYSMLTNEEVAHIAQRWPELRIILMLRDPIERAWSQVRFDWTRGAREKMDDIEDMKAFIDSPLATLRSDYVRMLDNWGRHFRAEQIFIGYYEDIQQQPAALLERVHQFLGVEPQPLQEEMLAQRVNQSREAEMPGEIRTYLIQKYGAQLAELSKRLGGPAVKWREDASRQP